MTNFEKWKQGLKLEDLYAKRPDGKLDWSACGLDCNMCPIQSNCEENINGDWCYKFLRRWANSEVRT